MDEIDMKALAHLMGRGRATWAELGERLGLSAPAAADRVRRLEERGVITGFSALVRPEAVGLNLAAFVAVTLWRPDDREAFLALVARSPQVQECHHVAGEHDYLLKLRCRDTRELEAVLSEKLKGLPGVTRTVTTIVLSTLKETPALPLPEGRAAPGAGRDGP
jgi:Lrp/AsnC family leucine-responsive transcriptional regulator